METTESKTVHIDYEFTYKNETYKATGADAGESLTSMRLLMSEWRTAAIFDALGDEYDFVWTEKTFGNCSPSPFQLRNVGFEFKFFNVYF